MMTTKGILDWLYLGEMDASEVCGDGSGDRQWEVKGCIGRGVFLLCKISSSCSWVDSKLVTN